MFLFLGSYVGEIYKEVMDGKLDRVFCRKMSCDAVCEEVGTISFFYNKILWTIPKFYDLEKNIRFKSPQFTLMGSTWQLRYCCFRSTLNSKEWLDIGVKFLTKTSGLEGQRVRFGISGNNLEISKTLQSNDLPKYYSLTLPYEDDMYAWIPEGNLCLFFTIENPEQNCGGDTSVKEKEEIGKQSLIILKRHVYFNTFPHS